MQHLIERYKEKKLGNSFYRLEKIKNQISGMVMDLNKKGITTVYEEINQDIHDNLRSVKCVWRNK